MPAALPAAFPFNILTNRQQEKFSSGCRGPAKSTCNFPFFGALLRQHNSPHALNALTH
jgi:hypothetical protein